MATLSTILNLQQNHPHTKRAPTTGTLLMMKIRGALRRLRSILTIMISWRERQNLAGKIAIKRRRNNRHPPTQAKAKRLKLIPELRPLVMEPGQLLVVNRFARIIETDYKILPTSQLSVSFGVTMSDFWIRTCGV
jgi:hypothetical protein